MTLSFTNDLVAMTLVGDPGEIANQGSGLFTNAGIEASPVAVTMAGVGTDTLVGGRGYTRHASFPKSECCDSRGYFF